MYKKDEGTRSGNGGTQLLSNHGIETAVTSRSSAIRATAARRSARAFAYDVARRGPGTFFSECVLSSPLFTGLSETAHEELCDRATERSFLSGEMIFREDDPVRFVDVIGSGSVKITQLSREGGEVILRVNGAGCLLDGMGDASETVHTTSAWAIRDCSILSWETSEFAKFVERYPLILRNAASIVKHRLKTLEQSFCDISTARVPQRLARLLLRLSVPQCNSTESLGLSREELAQMTGTSLFTISRLLRDWAERQIVYVTRNAVEIEDRQALQELADQSDRLRFHQGNYNHRFRTMPRR